MIAVTNVTNVTNVMIVIKKKKSANGCFKMQIMRAFSPLLFDF